MHQRFASHPHRAHPRSRGENLYFDYMRFQTPGSSPLTRGKRNVSFAKPFRKGLIPAHAGKTMCVSMHSRSTAAHPRSRGENAALSPSCTSVVGSSPLTRGKRLERFFHAADRGLIPAHAGKTAHHPGQRPHPGAHPRSRGENCRRPIGRLRSPGSSPLTRGKRICIDCTDPAPGLIPAHAGKTAAMGVARR